MERNEIGHNVYSCAQGKYVMTLKYLSVIVRVHACLLLMMCIVVAQRVPEWVESRPKMPSQYIGIGIVETAGKSPTEYKQSANHAAWIEISSHVSVDVAGDFEEYVAEAEGVSKEEAAQRIISNTVGKLEGLELVADALFQRDGEKYFGVFWTLSKDVFEQTIKKYEAEAISFFQQAQNLPLPAVTGRLGLLIKSLEAIHRALNREVSADVMGETIILNSEVPHRIEQIISQIEVAGINTLQSARLNEPLDAPLKFSASYNLMGMVIPLQGLSVEFSFSQGGGMFVSGLAMTDNGGECQAQVSKIVAQEAVQTIQAAIDLKGFKSSTAPFPGFDSYLDALSLKKAVYYSVSLTGLAAERIAIKVFGEQGIPTPEIGYINEVFISAAKQLTEFEVIERGLMEEVLEEQGFNVEECSSAECQVQVGKMLAVRKMIYAILWKFGTEYRGSLKLVNIETGENEHVESVKFNGTINQLADSGIPVWVKTFYESYNVGRLSITSSLSDVHVYSGSDLWGTLPLLEKKLNPGSYELKFVRGGYESKENSYTIALGQKISEHIELSPKKKGKAFMKSLFFPGLGQFYASDQNNPGRGRMGTIFALTGIAAIAGTGYSWNSFVEAQNAYDDAYSFYQTQNQLDDINAAREAAQDKNSLMFDSRNLAVAVSGATAALWFLSAIEAVIGFPDYGVSFSSGALPAYVYEDTFPTLTWSITF